MAADGSDLTGLAGVVVDVVDALGSVGVGLLVLAENLFPPIPSEVVLPLAGFLAGQGRLSLVAVLVASTVGSVLGAVLLHQLGARLGRDRLARWLDHLPLTGAEDLDRADAWFRRHGRSAVLLGRLVPGVRSSVSVPAGVSGMPLPTFVVLTTVGSAAWNGLLVGLGHVLGRQWTSVGDYSGPISWAVVGTLVAAVAVVAVRRVRRGGSGVSR